MPALGGRIAVGLRFPATGREPEWNLHLRRGLEIPVLNDEKSGLRPCFADSPSRGALWRVRKVPAARRLSACAGKPHAMGEHAAGTTILFCMLTSHSRVCGGQSGNCIEAARMRSRSPGSAW